MYSYIRGFSPLFPEVVGSAEQLEKIRNQVTHHIVVGLLYNKNEDDIKEHRRALNEIQSKNQNIKIVLVEDYRVLPE